MAWRRGRGLECSAGPAPSGGRGGRGFGGGGVSRQWRRWGGASGRGGVCVGGRGVVRVGGRGLLGGRGRLHDLLAHLADLELQADLGGEDVGEARLEGGRGLRWGAGQRQDSQWGVRGGQRGANGAPAGAVVACRAPLGSIVAHLAPLAPSRAHFSPILAHLEPCWPHLGSMLALLGPALDPVWSILAHPDPSWPHLRHVMAPLGPTLAHLNSALGLPWPSWRLFGPFLGYWGWFGCLTPYFGVNSGDFGPYWRRRSSQRSFVRRGWGQFGPNLANYGAIWSLFGVFWG